MKPKNRIEIESSSGTCVMDHAGYIPIKKPLYPYLTLSIQSVMIPARSIRWQVVQSGSRQELDMSSYVNAGLRVDKAHIRYLSAEIGHNRDLQSVNQDDPTHQGSPFRFIYIRYGPRYYSTLVERFTWPSEPVPKVLIFECKAYRLAPTSDITSRMTFCIRNVYSDAWWSQRIELRSKALRERV